MKKDLWIIITLVAAFTGYMMGYAVPPFMEVGIGGSDNAIQAGGVDEEVMRQYEQLYQTEE